MSPPPVLLVEDDPPMGEVLSEVLDEAGYTVTLADSGAEAVNLLAQQTFAVVISDIRMPAVNGIDVLHAARQAPSQPEVILLTGHGALDTSLAALREGAFDYLLKPCHPERLLQRVADAITTRETRLQQTQVIQQLVAVFGDTPEMPAQATPQTPPAQDVHDAAQERYQVGALCIGEAHHEATLAGEPLHLTPTEHTLLWAMVRRPGKVFSYRELVYAMHGYEVSTAESKILLKTHIRNLRHKLGAGYLINIRSAGYQLVAPDASTSVDEADDDDDNASG